ATQAASRASRPRRPVGGPPLPAGIRLTAKAAGYLRRPWLPQPSVMVVRGQGRVVVDALAGLRVGVHQRHPQVWDGMPELVLGGDSHLVRLDHAGTGVDDHLALGVQFVADPAQPELAD